MCQIAPGSGCSITLSTERERASDHAFSNSASGREACRNGVVSISGSVRSASSKSAALLPTLPTIVRSNETTDSKLNGCGP